MADIEIFYANDGVNVNKLNSNFSLCKTDSNNNETQLSQIANTALLKDGSNLTQNIVNQFNQNIPKIINSSGNISVLDNDTIFLTLTGNGTIQLPIIPNDNFSHTIIIVVKGGTYSLNLGTTKHLVNNMNINIENDYSIMYVLNKLDNSWYYCLTQ